VNAFCNTSWLMVNGRGTSVLHPLHTAKQLLSRKIVTFERILTSDPPMDFTTTSEQEGQQISLYTAISYHTNSVEAISTQSRTP
jgi:hypothetical protein